MNANLGKMKWEKNGVENPKHPKWLVPKPPVVGSMFAVFVFGVCFCEKMPYSLSEFSL